MGNTQGLPDAHVRIYGNLLGIQSSQKRTQMIQTILSSQEHLESAKYAGVFGHLLHYVQVTQAGGAAPSLPGEKRSPNGGQGQQLAVHVPQTQKHLQASQKGNEKAMNYFSACLRILNLEEEVALNEEALKAAYKKAVVRAHPDKQGGSEKEFEAVTRAYAYLGDILKRIQGGKKMEDQAPPGQHPQLQNGSGSTHWDSIKPVSLNPDKLDLNAFNQLFEKTRMPDPEEGGYGDWLKGEEKASTAPQFSGKFNRDVFNQAFAEDAKVKVRPRAAGSGVVVQEQILSNRLGYATELGRTARGDYTAANDDRLQFTDLKKAYTEYNTFSHEVADVKVEARSFDQYTKARKEAPPPLTQQEADALQEYEKREQAYEAERQRRKDMEAQQEADYFSRMKRLVVGLPPPKE
jgi:curved DNA-binding protein CbpA